VQSRVDSQVYYVVLMQTQPKPPMRLNFLIRTSSLLSYEGTNILSDHATTLYIDTRQLVFKNSTSFAPQVRFEFQSSTVEDIQPKEHLKIHETVAECMILANHWVAKKIAKSFPHSALLRRHPQPKKENFEELVRCASSKGWNVETFSNRALAESLDKCADPNDAHVNFLLRSLATYAMVQAVYFSTGN
jgi:hypothetical protein